MRGISEKGLDWVPTMPGLIDACLDLAMLFVMLVTIVLEITLITFLLHHL